MSMCSPRAVSYDLIRAVCVALRARARHWVRMDYFCLLTLRPECIAAWISVARLIATRFRAYSQEPHVSMCSPRAVRNDLIRAVCVTLRARARHWVRMDYLCRRTRRKTYAYRGACVRLTPGARLFIGSYSQNTCYISVRDVPATLVDVFWRKAARSSHRTRRAYQERTPRVGMQVCFN